MSPKKQPDRSDVPVVLERTSAAFRTYLAIESLPDQPVRHFEIEVEYPVVYQGEIFCRMSGVDGSNCCGVRRSGKGRLNTHLEEEHGFGRPDRHDNSKGKGSRKKALEDAQDFYADLMQDTPSVGDELVQQQPTPEPRIATPPPTSTPGSGHVKQEDQGNMGREIIEIESSPEPEPAEVKVEPAQVNLALQSGEQERQKRKRGENGNEDSDSNDEELLADLRESRLQRELKEAELREVQLERKIAARKKR